ncbi:MAG: DNA gyrase inhibitor YacG [Pseudomonadota bacterium]
MTPPSPCPICNKAADTDYTPFCSKRCADVDLNRWLSGGYAVPGIEDDSEGAGDNPSQNDTKPFSH